MRIADSIVRLFFTTPLHIGNERSDYALANFIMHSDAFMAAIFHAWSRLGWDHLIPADAQSSPGFFISSLFPFVKLDDKHYCYFLPKPRWRPSGDDKLNGNDEHTKNTKLRKMFKKVAYVDWTLFQKMLSGESTQSSVPAGVFCSTNKDVFAEPIIQGQVVPRATVSRTGKEDTVIFYMERYYFRSDKTGLYCLIHYEDNNLRPKVEAAIRMLGKEGIGTDRNIGNGKFRPEFTDEVPTIDIKSAKEPQHAVNLGLFCPESYHEFQNMIDVHDPLVSYDLIRRSGWLSEPYQTWRKRAVYMFKEGSVFRLPANIQNSQTLVKGRMVDLRPQQVQPPITHPVWRCGRTLFVPF